MTNCNSQSFVTEPVPSLLMRNSLPMVGAILALLAYDLFESALIALKDANTLAAFGFTLPITAAMTALAIGLSIRSNNKAIQTNCLSAHQLPQQVSHSLLSTVIIVGVFSLVFYLLHEHLLWFTGYAHWLVQGVNPSVVDSQTSYMELRYLGWVFLALLWQANAMLRALGWMKTASRLMFSWIALKAVLAFVLLFPTSPYQSADFSGLGYAHLLSDMIFAFLSLLALSRKVSFKWPQISGDKKIRIKPQKEGLLVVIQQFITPLSMAVLTAIAASIDTSYVAALALLFRLEVLFLLLPMVLTTSMPAIVGANFWLGHKVRVNKIYQLAFVSIALFQLLVAILVYNQGQLISMFICPHDAVSMHLETYLKWVPWGYTAAGIAIVFQSCLNAKNQTLYATLLGLSHRILFVLPLTALGGLAFGSQGFYQGMMLGHFGAIITVLYLSKRLGLTKETSTSSPTHTKQLEGIKHES